MCMLLDNIYSAPKTSIILERGRISMYISTYWSGPNNICRTCLVAALLYALTGTPRPRTWSLLYKRTVDATSPRPLRQTNRGTATAKARNTRTWSKSISAPRRVASLYDGIGITNSCEVAGLGLSAGGRTTWNLSSFPQRLLAVDNRRSIRRNELL
jgi:hypothetical protein